LSFPTDDPEGFGEIIFCPDVVARQAKDNKQSFDDELGYLILHGVLHLLGFDHEKDKAEGEKMLAMQDEIYAGLLKSVKPVVKKVQTKKSLAKISVKKKVIKKAPLKKKAKPKRR
jgi:ssRNA-specific RNase YbeY (16S rRNA maturation enzyme)